MPWRGVFAGDNMYKAVKNAVMLVIVVCLFIAYLPGTAQAREWSGLLTESYPEST